METGNIERRMEIYKAQYKVIEEHFKHESAAIQRENSDIERRIEILKAQTYQSASDVERRTKIAELKITVTELSDIKRRLEINNRRNENLSAKIKDFVSIDNLKSPNQQLIIDMGN
ncbi:hypothetical protein K7432_008911 [Basidiobolus ranarum]|uniref:Uncharacterized protein n=1 Tax=Basidiobolus ranarum TaxID=34480 RepID=A0ABR2WR36_9FUNG